MATPQFTESRVLLLGLLLGMAFGVLLLLGLLLEGMLVAMMGLIGAGLAWMGHGMLTGRFAFRAAWRALRGE